MKISLVLAAYNGACYIEKQLLSIINQTRCPDEVIICDDHSNDDTFRLIKKFIDSNKECKEWQLLRNKDNIGYRKNYYKLISMTSGDIIFLCDQDDIWDRNKIEKMEHIMISHENVDVLNSSFRFIDKSDKIIYKKKKIFYTNNNLIPYPVMPHVLSRVESAYIILKNNISPGCTLCMTKKAKELFIKYYVFAFPHDFIINLLAACSNHCYFYNKKLVNYRLHDTNTIGFKKNDAVAGISTIEKKISEQKNRVKERIVLLRFANYRDKKNIEEYITTRTKYLNNNCPIRLFFILIFRYFKYYYYQVELRGIISEFLLSIHLHNMYLKYKRLICLCMKK